MKKELIPQPYAAEMTYDENCWLVIDCRSNDSAYVSYYNPNQDKEFETIQSFAECYFDNEFSSYDEKEIEYKDNQAIASGCSASEDDDYDEESRRSWKVWSADGQLVKVITGIKEENIKEEVKKAEKELGYLEEETLDGAKDAAEEARDPYGYRGLRRSDFF